MPSCATFSSSLSSPRSPPALARSALQLRWELKEDVFRGPKDAGAGRVTFTLTNGGAKPLPSRVWAIYFSALHEPFPGTAKGAFKIDNVTATSGGSCPAPTSRDCPRVGASRSGTASLS